MTFCVVHAVARSRGCAADARRSGVGDSGLRLSALISSPRHWLSSPPDYPDCPDYARPTGSLRLSEGGVTETLSDALRGVSGDFPGRKVPYHHPNINDAVRGGYGRLRGFGINGDLRKIYATFRFFRFSGQA